MGIREGNWFWCSTCGRGVEGVLGKPCPQCELRLEGDRTGTLQTPDQAVAEHLRKAEAIKLTRQDKVVKGIKTIDEMHAELKKEIKETMLVEIREQIKKELMEEIKLEMRQKDIKVEEEKFEQEELVIKAKEEPKKETKKSKVTSSTKKSLQASGSPKS